ncbi:hypothetical protein JTE90_004647 [Oedothorax gibbosus]|uniref:Uncharacterized protein n=1 Tax=Oedothorax gibbosus TaxID=931172 RepID=A0AAV6UWI2_9ARAC|nr:hypothetical protein JTE90_004647 [Oedothorax gibbosus]
MQLIQRRWQEAFLYASGMLTIILGVGSCIVSIDPTPLPSNTWWYFLVAGVFLFVVGCLLLKIVICAPVYPGSFFTVGPSANATASSAVDLLDDAQSVGYADSPIVDLRDSVFGIEDEPSQVVRQCMMTRSDEPQNSVLFYYKETFV